MRGDSETRTPSRGEAFQKMAGDATLVGMIEPAAVAPLGLEDAEEAVSVLCGAFRDYPVIDIDGVRIHFPDGWGLIRASNTQPALVLRFEASSPAALARIRSTVEGELGKVVGI